jgi:hypothetical protein
MGWVRSFAGWQWADWAELVAVMGSCVIAIFICNRRLALALTAIMLTADLIDPIFSLLGIGT